MSYEIVCRQCRLGCGHHHQSIDAARRCPGAHPDVSAGHDLEIVERSTGRTADHVRPRKNPGKPDVFFMEGVSGSLPSVARASYNFREVLHTGEHMQIVMMSIPPGGEIGLEKHAHVEQLFYVVWGEGEAIVGGRRFKLTTDAVLVVPPGTEHNIRCTGRKQALQLWTVYSPPNHLPGRIHETRAAALADTEDEAFGEAVRGCR